MTDYKNTMLVSPKVVKQSGELNLNCDDSQIGASIRTAQNVYMVDVLGSALIERLQELVYRKIQGESGDTIDSEENIAYKTLLDDYLTEALTYKTVIDLCMRSTFKVRNMGVVQNTDTNVLSANIDDIKHLQNYIETMYNHSLNRMAEFICANKDAFVENKIECGPCKGMNKYANINLWLGK